METTRAQIILAPSRQPFEYQSAVFLAGTTTAPDWREELISSLSHEPITILNPLRLDWDSSWREDETFEPFREQVQWELDMQDKADLVVIYFGANTDAPISLLELGLCARTNKALVVCHHGYRKRGNVQVICRRYNIRLMESLDGLAEAVVEKLNPKNSLI
ncbi:hypothetical protein NKR19_g7711 [Coniochaeta hoffmannii]|uniref:Nucleoside 2-deoxyribosyltransferase n=1 Tax=Coniochaeta hoffmannii TaxID=91930 RepID=A0AA38VLD9_9PEZI|nr:hypothetical protein NKR19_g7711 [Coniochaeta hoffmannii]